MGAKTGGGPLAKQLSLIREESEHHSTQHTAGDSAAALAAYRLNYIANDRLSGPDQAAILDVLIVTSERQEQSRRASAPAVEETRRTAR